MICFGFIYLWFVIGLAWVYLFVFLLGSFIVWLMMFGCCVVVFGFACVGLLFIVVCRFVLIWVIWWVVLLVCRG